MPKLLWVALPLLVAAVLLAVLLLRGRRPSRAALNAWASLLLAAYLLTTAGLGIFWVANQQLPVFEWHYLFGYGTVLLVAVHLAINLPALWRYLTRRPASPAHDSRTSGRRIALATLAAGIAAAAGFVLGLRHGRSELKLDTAAAAPESGGLAIVERFHAFSSHTRGGVLLRAPGSEWEAERPAFKHYPGAQRLALPPPRGVGAAAPALARVGAALWHTSGVTERRGGLALRASPSSGALFSTELYLQARSLEGLPPGLWHYDAEGHALERVADAFGPLADANAAVIATAVFGRTGRKYRDRTYRYVLADLGHALENLRIAASTLALQPEFAPAFDEVPLAQALRLDEREEGVLAVAVLGPTREAAPPVRLSRSPPPTFAGASALSVTASIHAATSWRMASPPTAPSQHATARTADIALPRAAPREADPLATVASRRSVRRFSTDGAVPLEALAAILARMADPRAAPFSGAVRVYLVANAVEGLAPGAYAYLPQPHALAHTRPALDLRHAAQASALDQDVIGDAAAVFVLAIDRSAVAADPLGAARGYRHAFLQAGLSGERIYLEAIARGLGACAVGAFYDAEAAALVGVDPAREWIVHFAALGLPASG